MPGGSKQQAKRRSSSSGAARDAENNPNPQRRPPSNSNPQSRPRSNSGDSTAARIASAEAAIRRMANNGTTAGGTVSSSLVASRRILGGGGAAAASAASGLVVAASAAAASTATVDLTDDDDDGIIMNGLLLSPPPEPTREQIVDRVGRKKCLNKTLPQKSDYLLAPMIKNRAEILAKLQQLPGARGTESYNNFSTVIPAVKPAKMSGSQLSGMVVDAYYILKNYIDTAERPSRVIQPIFEKLEEAVKTAISHLRSA